jgi:hypothetical protein
MKQANKIGCQLDCKATASLNSEVKQDMEKQDKSLGELLDEKEKNRDENSICESGDSDT